MCAYLARSTENSKNNRDGGTYIWQTPHPPQSNYWLGKALTKTLGLAVNVQTSTQNRGVCCLLTAPHTPRKGHHKYCTSLVDVGLHPRLTSKHCIDGIHHGQMLYWIFSKERGQCYQILSNSQCETRPCLSVEDGDSHSKAIFLNWITHMLFLCRSTLGLDRSPQ